MSPSQPPPRGFRDCFNDLSDRRLRELGASWEGVNSRSRRAVASRRAREEMVRRIETRAGRRYATSTIARWAARNQWPPGIETFWFDRWATIDRAGGIAALAASLRSTAGRVIAWRDSLDPNAPPPRPVTPAIPEEPQEIGVETLGILQISDTLQYDKRIPTDSTKDYEVLRVDPDIGVLQAWFDDDEELLKGLLSDLITDQVLGGWDVVQHYECRYTVTKILKFLPNLDDV